MEAIHIVDELHKIDEFHNIVTNGKGHVPLANIQD
jgi:hypothetical protein